MKAVRYGGWCLLAALLGSSPAAARCTYNAPFNHSFSYFACADFQPVSDLAYQADDPTGATSGTVDTACEQASCSNNPDAGVIGDGKVIIGFDWASPGTEGCPGDLGPGAIRHRVNIIVQGSDGRGLIASLGRGNPGSTYSVEAAHRLSAPNGSVFPLPCTDQAGKPEVISRQELTPGQVTLDLRFAPPLVYSDCDPGARGILVGSCTDGFQANPSIGRVFTSVIQDCAMRADLRRSLWTNTGQVPDAEGRLTLTVPRPGGSQCLLVGMTSIIGGYESGGITGFVKVPGLDCHDADADGWSDCEADCADDQPAVFPGNTEVCDFFDNDCDGVADEGQTTCGVGTCQRTVADCVNGTPQACTPGTPSAEICDGLDNDCNGLTDEADPDGDGYRCAADCDETNPLVHRYAPEICDGIDNDCDGRLDEDPYGVDPDLDGIPSACDVCPSYADPDQVDSDSDGDGDACDFDDGEIRIFPAAPPTVLWQSEATFSSFNLYRADLEVLRLTGQYTQDPAQVPNALQVCAQTGSSFSDTLTPLPGEMFIYHVTGNCDGTEGSLGTTSGGAPRPNDHPCPTIDASQCPVCDKPATRILRRTAPNLNVPDGNRVIDNQTDWNLFCNQAGAGAACSSMIDFQNEIAIVSKISGSCVDTEIACVQTVGATADLHVVVRRTTAAPPPCGCLLVVLDSYDVVKVARPVGAVTFETRSAPALCPQY